MKILLLLAALIWTVAIASVAAQSKMECNQRWVETEASGTAVSHGLMEGVVTIVVNERAWSTMDLTSKTGLADTYNCAIFGDGRTFGVVEFVSNSTNNRVGIWTDDSGMIVLDQ